MNEKFPDLNEMKPIVIIEGPDASGKSFLANQIMQKYPNHVYIHNAVSDDIQSLHMNTIRSALIAAVDHTVIIDRLHLSEMIYGTVFRNGPSYDIEEFEQHLGDIPSVVKILCIVDKETTLKKHDERLDQEMFSDISNIWELYDQYKGEKWIRYNWKTDDIDLNTFEVTKKQQ